MLQMMAKTDVRKDDLRQMLERMAKTDVTNDG